MTDFEEAREFGFVYIPEGHRCCFIVKINNYRQVQLYTIAHPTQAYWSGGSLIVHLEDGSVFRYYGLSEGSCERVYV